MRFITGPSQPAEFMKRSCELLNVPLEVHNYGEFDWVGRTGFDGFLKFLASIPRSEIILTTDSWDAFFAGGPIEIESKFLKLDTPILFSAEVGLWPPEAARFGSYPESPTHWRYINGGGFMGYAGALLDMLGSPLYWQEREWCNQLAYHRWFMKKLGGPMKIDCRCEIFCALHSGPQRNPWIAVQNGRVVCLDSSEQPCIVHGNGGHAWEAIELFNEMLNQQGISRYPEHQQVDNQSQQGRREARWQKLGHRRIGR